jgi:hypothetical protein
MPGMREVAGRCWRGESRPRDDRGPMKERGAAHGGDSLTATAPPAPANYASFSGDGTRAGAAPRASPASPPPEGPWSAAPPVRPADRVRRIGRSRIHDRPLPSRRAQDRAQQWHDPPRARDATLPRPRRPSHGANATPPRVARSTISRFGAWFPGRTPIDACASAPRIAAAASGPRRARLRRKCRAGGPTGALTPACGRATDS